MTKPKQMCMWCQRAPREPHLANCPVITTDNELHTDHNLRVPTKRNKATYLRRSRPDLAKRTVLPRVMYFVETDVEPDTPKDLYEFDLQHGL